MQMTTATLETIERESANASIWTLKHYIGLVRNGLDGVTDGVAEHGRALLIKLDHLASQQLAPWSTPCSSPKPSIAPAMTLAEPVRVAA